MKTFFVTEETVSSERYWTDLERFGQLAKPLWPVVNCTGLL
jgi:hypothetical protein